MGVLLINRLDASTLSGDKTHQQSSDLGLRVGGTLTTKGFDCPWAKREGARRLALALPPPIGGYSHFEMYKHQELMGDTSISMAGTLSGGTPTTEGFDCP